MSRRMATRGEEAKCPVRALFRVNVRHHLRKAGFQELAESVFARTCEEDENIIRQYPAFVTFRKILVRLQEERKCDFVQLVIDLRAYQGTAQKSFELYTAIANRMWTRPNFGRIASLITFCGFASVELAENGVEFLRSVLGRIEDDVDQRVHVWLHQSGNSMEYFARDSKSDIEKSWDWKKPLDAIGLGGVAALAGSAVVLAAVLAK